MPQYKEIDIQLKKTFNVVFNKFFLRSPNYFNFKDFCFYSSHYRLKREQCKNFLNYLINKKILVHKNHSKYNYGYLPVKIFVDIPEVVSIMGDAFGPAIAEKIVRMPKEHALLFVINNKGKVEVFYDEG
ncbi:MAG: hypothetical protein QXJ06_02040 [Candidatus Aenigmatarchaeota archaeon]